VEAVVDAEVQQVGVEGDAAFDVADVEHGVVETLDRHVTPGLVTISA
jgi:hypothetical protein